MIQNAEVIEMTALRHRGHLGAPQNSCPNRKLKSQLWGGGHVFGKAPENASSIRAGISVSLQCLLQK